LNPPPPELPRAAVEWQPSYRLIPSRYPTVGLFDRIADPADIDVVVAIESLTNARIRDELGQLHLVPREQRISGPGSTPIMAAFTHLNPEGSRFTDGSYGVYYATESLHTAVAEVSHHRALFLSRTAEPPMDVDLRLITAGLRAELHDARALRDTDPAIYHPVHYSAPQALGRALRASGSAGLLYHSVRRAGGLCAAVFDPRALQPATATRHLALHWNGQRITHWYEKQEPQALA
jgi:hypothetical protein